MSNAPAATPPEGVAAAPSRAFRIEAFVFVGLFIALGIAIVVGAFGISGAVNVGGLSPRVAPLAIGVLMIVSAVVVLIEQLRGRFGSPDGGEDVDLEASTSWSTVLIILASFASLIVTIGWLGWPLAVTILFFGAATALGAKPWWKPLVVGLIIGVLTQFIFGNLLGLSLPATGDLTRWIGL